MSTLQIRLMDIIYWSVTDHIHVEFFLRITSHSLFYDHKFHDKNSTPENLINSYLLMMVLKLCFEVGISAYI